MAKNKVVNTAGEVGGLELLMAAMSGNQHGIEDQEARGQAQLLESDVLPSDLGERYEKDAQAAYEALGFTFGPVIEGDPMFREATLPKGWKRQGSSHAMWSYIVDERGISRVGIFYKAASYDRSAHMHIENVGRQLASGALYGDGPIDAAVLRLADLTDAEKVDLRSELDRMRESIKSSPSIYGKYTERLAACDKVLGL